MPGYITLYDHPVFPENNKNLLWAEWIVYFLFKPRSLDNNNNNNIKNINDNLNVKIEWSSIRHCHAKYLVYWTIMLGLFSILVSKFLITDKDVSSKETVVNRKYFHIFACVIFLPCTIYAPDMMALSNAVACCFLIVLETLRLTYFRTGPLNDFICYFLDAKETPNNLVLTHLYLITGCALGVWVGAGSNGVVNRNVAIIGILTVGVGDCFAAIVGIKFGRTPWPNNPSRTVEGSICCFISMLLVGRMAGCSIEPDHLLMLLMVTLLEANTNNVDNLVLPIAGCGLMAM